MQIIIIIILVYILCKCRIYGAIGEKRGLIVAFVVVVGGMKFTSSLFVLSSPYIPEQSRSKNNARCWLFYLIRFYEEEETEEEENVLINSFAPSLFFIKISPSGKCRR